MIIRNDSPLKRLPANLVPRQRLFFDGIRYSVEMADLAYASLRDAVYQISLAGLRNDKLPSHVYPLVYLHAWSVIDSVNRLRVLQERFPAKKKSRGFHTRAFLAATADVEKLRHGVQHLDERIEKLVGESKPVWGSISWVAMFHPDDRVATVHTLIGGTIADGEHPPPNPLGEPMRSPIDFITLNAYGISVNLSRIIESVERVVRAWERGLEDKFKEFPAAGADVWISLEIGFEGEGIPGGAGANK